MISIYELTDSVLATIGLPFYYGMPVFSKDNPEPPAYLVYDDYETPVYLGDGTYPRKKYTITVNKFSETVDAEMDRKIESAFMRSGYIYLGGGKVGDKDSFPYKHQNYKEFSIIMEV